VHLHVVPNLREGPTCKGDTVTRPSADGAAESVTTVPTLPRSLPAAFGAGAGVGVIGGLISLGGAEFRLPPLIGVFGFLALQAVIMNKAMSLIVVLTALPARLAAVPIDTLTDYWFVVVNLLAGSLIGAWIGATWATRMRSITLHRVLDVLLVLIAVALAWDSHHSAQMGTRWRPTIDTTVARGWCGGGCGDAASRRVRTSGCGSAECDIQQSKGCSRRARTRLWRGRVLTTWLQNPVPARGRR
jgi:hypothetical protein